MANKTHPYIWMMPDGGYEYGLHTDGKPDATRKRFGTAGTREAAGQALIANLQRKYTWVTVLRSLSFGAACGLLALAFWPHMH